MGYKKSPTFILSFHPIVLRSCSQSCRERFNLINDQPPYDAPCPLRGCGAGVVFWRIHQCNHSLCQTPMTLLARIWIVKSLEGNLLGQRTCSWSSTANLASLSLAYSRCNFFKNFNGIFILRLLHRILNGRLSPERWHSEINCICIVFENKM